MVGHARPHAQPQPTSARPTPSGLVLPSARSSPLAFADQPARSPQCDAKCSRPLHRNAQVNPSSAYLSRNGIAQFLATHIVSCITTSPLGQQLVPNKQQRCSSDDKSNVHLYNAWSVSLHTSRRRKTPTEQGQCGNIHLVSHSEFGLPLSWAQGGIALPTAHNISFIKSGWFWGLERNLLLQRVMGLDRSNRYLAQFKSGLDWSPSASSGVAADAVSAYPTSSVDHDSADVQRRRQTPPAEGQYPRDNENLMQALQGSRRGGTKITAGPTAV